MRQGRTRTGWTLTIAASLALTAAAPVSGQSDRDRAGPKWEAGLFGGGTLVGEFVEQRTAAGVERELTGSSSAFFGASLGLSAWEKTEIRVTGALAPTELEFQDDDALTATDAADVSDLADLDVWLFGVEGSQFLTSADVTVAPYLTAGLVGTIWSLDAEPSSPVGPGTDGSDSQFQFGALTGAGVRLNLPDRWGVEIEARRYTVGNPFDGSDAFALEGDTFDEPGTTALTTGTFAVTYSF